MSEKSSCRTCPAPGPGTASCWSLGNSGRRRHAARPVAGGVGDCRGPQGRPRGRPLPDGGHHAAAAADSGPAKGIGGRPVHQDQGKPIHKIKSRSSVTRIRPSERHAAASAESSVSPRQALIGNAAPPKPRAYVSIVPVFRWNRRTRTAGMRLSRRIDFFLPFVLNPFPVPILESTCVHPYPDKALTLMVSLTCTDANDREKEVLLELYEWTRPGSSAHLEYPDKAPCSTT